ncbi:uncharacterized protein AMSG_00803 [Thecamonas trahens ATCC 50062]|uniref:Uncharacterized protein n=1 Tax=Thecamonas trahens ATCC 50062 TaxID=461836 RepID=A0A0L0DES4_THETB|nr:hypothetical protein AMSG_00803 [Thecamonas trahens ATCC 50062]KNC50641.1 hypothetical protein AMSG_00803 [Thecamonas trahens ATCC 50062]|eukprot:XP_013762527.1 hypothetical protein AMSG_00803 [Thecamonas trahens ATCC 50062]
MATPTPFERLALHGVAHVRAAVFARTTAAAAAAPAAAAAATAIQAAARGAAVRREASEAAAAAAVIQRAWRAHLARAEGEAAVDAAAAALAAAWYAAAATAIQRVFRGFISRKYVADMQRRRAYLDAVAANNAVVRKELDAYAAASAAAAAEADAAAMAHAFLSAATSVHHLVGTAAIPGVFTPAGRPPPISPFGDTVEESIKYAFARQMAAAPAPRATGPPRPPSSVSPNAMSSRAATRPQPAGPFKPRTKVWRQRLRVAQPSTKRADPYDASKHVARDEARLSKLLRVVPDDFVAVVPPSKDPPLPVGSVRASDPYAPLRPDKIFRANEPAAGTRPRFRATFRTRDHFGQDPEDYANVVV